MRRSLFLASCIAAAHAWENTSPFLLFSNSPSPNLHIPSQSLSPQLQSASSVLSTARPFLKECESDIYIVLTQPHLSPLDFHPELMPHLFRSSQQPEIKTRYSVSNVLAYDAIIGTDSLQSGICGGGAEFVGWETVSGEGMENNVRDGKKMVIWREFDGLLSLGGFKREEVIRDNDAEISTILRTIPATAKYTIIYTSTPLNSTYRSPIPYTNPHFEEPTIYEPEFESESSAHMELRRDYLEGRVPQKTIETDQRPLFEKYQFLTPGIFMGAITLIIMFMILSVGISAVSSLQVSYGAFEKENAVAAAKK